MSDRGITYDGAPSYSVSVMELADQQVVHETRYFAAPLGTPRGGPRSQSRCLDRTVEEA
ncbi:hypothetical protein A6P39_001580 [Streptomyces sp. FXJ1.172]|uniref:hypothetical protein n=1 Tax=Streptomyces sp. FXJ1.172 TaxID=710705 RepID=UPI0018FEFF8A|nr:hypothetical protein [Streptomyces sp. FXJ1.172]WEO92901.1 hypothetical protein A6P39_001580 [Streptomyces sp. FXJ1.172]